jgi:putative hydrolase of HD superfamily
MDPSHDLVHDLQSRLEFIQAAERLKFVLRSAHASNGRQESTAEHSWRLCLLAITMQDLLEPLNFERVLKLCVVHDLAEAISGDIPATEQTAGHHKSAQERADLQTLTAPLPTSLRQQVLDLWEEYEGATTAEARVVKALDKLETLIQHNQGANPPGFNYRFNLDYGSRHTQAHAVLARLRSIVDERTRELAQQAGQWP